MSAKEFNWLVIFWTHSPRWLIDKKKLTFHPLFPNPPYLLSSPPPRQMQKRPEPLVVVGPAPITDGSVFLHSSSFSACCFLPSASLVLFFDDDSHPSISICLCCCSVFLQQQGLDDDVLSVRSYRVCSLSNALFLFLPHWLLIRKYTVRCIQNWCVKVVELVWKAFADYE